MGSLFCDDCRADVVWVRKPVCEQCGRPQPTPVEKCADCRRRPPSLVRTRAATLYLDPIRAAVRGLKYQNAFALAEPLANLMDEAWPLWQFPVDLVAPVPLHPERARKRGYNQAELLARHLVQLLGLEMRPDAVKRTRDTPPQTDLSGEARIQNVQGAFQADSTVVSGMHILLIDDVQTTGATLGASATALLAAGALSVSGFCLSQATPMTHSLITSTPQT